MKINIRTTVLSLLPGLPASAFSIPLPSLFSTQSPKWFFGNVRQIPPLPCSKFSSGFLSHSEQNLKPSSLSAESSAAPATSAHSRPAELQPHWPPCCSVSGPWNWLFPPPGTHSCDSCLHFLRSLLKCSPCQAAPPPLILHPPVLFTLLHRHQVIWSRSFPSCCLLYYFAVLYYVLQGQTPFSRLPCHLPSRQTLPMGGTTVGDWKADGVGWGKEKAPGSWQRQHSL